MNIDVLLKELKFKALRSSGPGGQHVNKTSSKVEVNFNIEESEALTPEEKKRLNLKLKNRISSEGILSLQCDESRSQHKNRAIAIERILHLLEENLKIPKQRKKTKPSKAAIERRLKLKKEQALKKKNRRPPSF